MQQQHFSRGDGLAPSPIRLRVLHRDPARATREREAKHGRVPAGYRGFRGMGYLVAATDAP